MQTHARITQQSQEGKPGSPVRPGAATRSRDPSGTLTVQHSIGNPTFPGTARGGSNDLGNVSSVTVRSRLGHDFARILVHARAPETIQSKLAVNTTGDIYEQEAYRIADQAMWMPTHQAVNGAPISIKGRSALSSEQVNRLPASVDHALTNSGGPLPPALRQDMEQRFGHDFSRVRVHTDRAATKSARDINAQSYTLGEHIVFNAGRFAPETRKGISLLAHELTHVVQQRRGGPTPPLSRSAAHEQDASRVETEVLTGQAPVQVACGTGVGVARNHDPGDEEQRDRPDALKAESGRLSREIQHTREIALDLLEEEGRTVRGVGSRASPALRAKRGLAPEGPKTQATLNRVIKELKRVAGSTSKAASRARQLSGQLEELRGKAQEVGAKLRDLYEAPTGSAESGTEKTIPASEVEDEVASAKQSDIMASKEGGGSPTQESSAGAAVTETASESREFTEHSSMVGGRLFAMVSIAGVLYAISEIHDFASAMRVSESLALTFGAGAIAEAVTASAGVVMVVPMLVGMEDDHGPGIHERWRKSAAVEAFLAKNFTPEQVQKNPDLRRQAEKLLFETKPMVIDDMREGAGMGSRAGAE
jgi:hypothetical protein